MTRRAKRINKAIIFGLLASNLVLGGMYYETNQQLNEVTSHYQHTNELNENLYNELMTVSKELEKQINKTNELEKELILEKEKQEQTQQDTNSDVQIGRQIIYSHVTAYTTGDSYTPSDTMANGEKVHVGAVAHYDLPLGTKVKINGAIYTVKDRCGIPNTIDIYMSSEQECLEFGRKYMEVEIL